MIRKIHGAERHLGGYKKDRPAPADRPDPMLPARDTSADPARLELDDSAIPVFDQGRLGSCTANGGCFQAAWLAFLLGVRIVYARLFMYALTRIYEGTSLTEDSGCEPRDVFMAWATYGLCEEKDWPYSDDGTAFTREPDERAKLAAAAHPALMFFRCGSVESIKQSLADGFPVGFGITLHESFESDHVAATGMVPMPVDGDKEIGGHWMVAVGKDDAMRIGNCVGAFKVRNSWGPDWALGGYCWIPYDMWRLGLATDNWTARRVG